MSIIKKQSGEGNLIPNRLGIFAHPGQGKTAIMSGLENSLLIDFEDRSHHHKGDTFNLKAYAAENNCSDMAALAALINSLKENAAQGIKYDFIIFDTMSSFEILIKERATMLFNESLIGKGMTKKGNNITEVVSQLANGGGYIWLHNAYLELTGKFAGLASKCYIYNCHIKQASKLKNSQELMADDINLTGKLKSGLIQDCQAFGKFYRNDKNEGILSFEQDERNLVTKASSPHLFDKEIVISTRNNDTGEISYHWDRIFNPK